MRPFDYFKPTDTETLFNLIHKGGDDIRLLAGGTDLLVRIKLGRATPRAVIDIKNIPDLNEGIHQESDGIHIGALTLMATLENDPLIKNTFPALAEATHNIGSVQIRNRATIAGNLCNASPAADSAPALLIYGARVACLSAAGRRILNLAEFILGPGKNALGPGEVVAEIIVPIPERNQYASFTRLTRRKGVDLATINLCCQVSENGTTRFVLGAVGPTPILVEETGGVLASATASDDEKKACIEKLMMKASPISDIRASAEYRQAMLTILGQRALENSLKHLGAVPQ